MHGSVSWLHLQGRRRHPHQGNNTKGAAMMPRCPDSRPAAQDFLCRIARRPVGAAPDIRFWILKDEHPYDAITRDGSPSLAFDICRNSVLFGIQHAISAYARHFTRRAFEGLRRGIDPVSYTHLRAHETDSY